MKILINDLFTFSMICLMGSVLLCGAILVEPVGVGNMIFSFLSGAVYAAAVGHVSVEKMSESEIHTERKLKS